MSGAEFCKKFASDGKKKSKSSGDSREVFDASGDADSDLWNKGSEGFKSRRRRSLETVKSRRRQQAREEAQEAAQEEKRKRSKRNKNVGSEPGDRGDSVGLRVVGGIFRGTKLRYAGDRRVRPMKERVREAIFNLLGESVKGKHAIDLFTGTGALCFEAISRGARSATAIEIHSLSHRENDARQHQNPRRKRAGHGPKNRVDYDRRLFLGPQTCRRRSGSGSETLSARIVVAGESSQRRSLDCVLFAPLRLFRRSGRGDARIAPNPSRPRAKRVDFCDRGGRPIRFRLA